MERREWKTRYCLEKIGGEKGLEKLREMYYSGMAIAAIMAELGLSSPDCIYALIDKRRRGAYKKRAKITPEVEAKIVDMRRKGLSIPEIAKRLGVSVGSVYRVLAKHGLAGGKKE